MKARGVLMTAAVVIAAAAVFLWFVFSKPGGKQTADSLDQTLADQLAKTRQLLASEKERNAQLMAVIKRLEGLVQINVAAGSAAAQGNNETLSASSDQELKRLKDENQRLRAELDNVKALLAKEIAQVNLKPTPKPSIAFHNPALMAVWQEVAVSTSKTRTLEILQSLAPYAAQQDVELIPILQQAMLGGDVDVCREAMHMVENYKNPAVLPLLEQGLVHPDGFTRLAALEPLETIINDPRAVNVLAIAFNDPAEEIRARAMKIVANQHESVQMLSLQEALKSSYADVGKQAVEMLQARRDKPSVDKLISALNHSNSDIRSAAKDALEFLVDQEFQTASEAAQWWKNNADRYDDDLAEK